jgi:predicted HTH domain antitoxin
MATKTLRMPELLSEAVSEVGRIEHLEESAAMRKLLHLGYQVYLGDQYRAGKVSLREVARRLGVSLSEALDALQRLGIPGNVGAEDTLQSLASLGPPGR